MSDKRYTAQKMRNYSNLIGGFLEEHKSDGLRLKVTIEAGIEIVAMLRQAAAMVERCERLLAKYNKMPCKQCADGEVEPDCPYFGEPNGCNSPTYGKFPGNEHTEDIDYILRGDAEEGAKDAK